MFNGSSRVFEIKTALDKMDRLSGQLEAYRRVFNEIYLIVPTEYLNNYLDCDKDVGIISFDSQENSFHLIRNANSLYFPYLRARQFELIALRELSAEPTFRTNVVPVLEPARESVNGLVLANKIFHENNFNPLSKPMRRYDSEIDYIPTQFICEFIKNFSGAQGLKFRSSLHAEGNNMVIFDQNIMLCESVEMVKVSKVLISI